MPSQDASLRFASLRRAKLDFGMYYSIL